jgi:chromosome segregation ATPase
MYKIKEELKNKDIKIGGVLYEKVIFNRDIETLTIIIDKNEKLLPYVVETEYSGYQDEINSINENLDILKSENEELSLASERYDKSLMKANNKHKAEVEQSKAKLDELNNELQNANNKSEDLNQQLKQVQNINAELQNKNAELEDRIQALKKLNDELKQLIEQLSNPS